jgi:hypothetical protein
MAVSRAEWQEKIFVANPQQVGFGPFVAWKDDN